jgi:hypothetical protein
VSLEAASTKRVELLTGTSVCVVHEITKGLARYPAQRFLGLSQAQNRRLRTLALLLGEYKSSFYVAEKSEIDFVYLISDP